MSDEAHTLAVPLPPETLERIVWLGDAPATFGTEPTLIYVRWQSQTDDLPPATQYRGQLH